MEATPAPAIPKLLRAYLSLGARICGAPAIDREFGTIDFLAVLDRTLMEAGGAGARGPDFVVREARARLAGVLHRRAMAAQAQVSSATQSKPLFAVTCYSPSYLI